MVKKSEWNMKEMPEQVEHFVIEKVLSNDELHAIQEGHKPFEMEDKWFMYYEDGQLFIHRSWTGYCIYIVDLLKTGTLNVTVNREPEQHKESSIECDRIMVTILINRLIGAHGKNAVLMKQYLSIKGK